jgi:hypothetical protein
MSFAITSISINTRFRIRDSLVASMSALERSTIVREVRLRNAPARIGPLGGSHLEHIALILSAART